MTVRVRFIMWLNGLLTEALAALSLKGSSAKRERESRAAEESQSWRLCVQSLAAAFHRAHVTVKERETAEWVSEAV